MNEKAIFNQIQNEVERYENILLLKSIENVDQFLLQEMLEKSISKFCCQEIKQVIEDSIFNVFKIKLSKNVLNVLMKNYMCLN